MAEEKSEFKDKFGLRVYKNGDVENLKSGNNVGFISNSGEYLAYVPDLKTTYKIAILVLALWKNNGILPDIPRKWKILYRDGDKLNCSLENLDYVDITDNPHKTPNEAKEKLYQLKLKKAKMIEEIEELDEEILDLTWMIASGEKVVNRANRIEEDKKRLEAKKQHRTPQVKVEHKKPKKKLGRPIGSSLIYLINRFDQTYDEMSLSDVAKKLGISESTASGYATQSTVVPGNVKYALTRNLGLVWDLMDDTIQ